LLVDSGPAMTLATKSHSGFMVYSACATNDGKSLLSSNAWFQPTTMPPVNAH
jgi:hypothetical protein